jgi:hypothetical protein
MTSRSTTMLVLALMACGDDGAAGTAAGDTGSEAGTHGTENSATDSTQGADSTGAADTTAGADSSGGSDTGGMLDPTPILEREPAISHSCSETREMAQLPGASAARWEGLLAGNGNFVALRSSLALELAAIDLDGTLGETVELDAFGTNVSFAEPLSVRDGDEIVTVWTRQNNLAEEVMRFARASDAPSLLGAPEDISSGTYVRPTTLVPADDGGFALIYAEGEASGATRLRFVRLDAAGAVVGVPVDVAQVGATYGNGAANAIAVAGGGYAVAYVAGEVSDSEVFFVVLDGEGQPRTSPRRISRAAEDGWSADFGGRTRHNLILVGDDVWLAFAEGQYDWEAMHGHVVVRIAILDEDGNGDAHLLQAPVEGKNNLWPSFVPVDDRVGVLWTSGAIIWICGGCITDYDLNFVLVDPDGVAPASEVVTQLHQNNGITAPLAALDAGDLLTLGSLDFHATTLPASGSLHCQPAG